MHFINANKFARRDMIIRFVMYLVLGIVAVLLTMLSVYALLGYDIDRRSGEIIRNGLILVNSTPDRPFIYVDGVRESVRSPARLALPAGEYNVRLELEGYRDWATDVTVAASEVSWLFYPKLVPEVIDTEVVDTFGNIRFYETSPRQNVLAINSEQDVSRIYIYSLLDPADDVEIVTLPSDIVASGIDPQIRVLDWHQDERFMLISLMHEESRRYAVLDLDNPNESVLLPLDTLEDATNVIFAERDNQIYFIKDQILRLMTIETNLVEAVGRYVETAMHAADSEVYAVTFNGEEYGLNFVENGELKRIATFPDVISILDVGVFDSQTFMMLKRGDKQALLLRDPIESAASSTAVPDRNFALKNGYEVDFSVDDRFVRVSDNEGTVIYDLEDTKIFEPDIKAEQVIGWFDSTRLALHDESMLVLSDFDGLNRYRIVDVLPDVLPAIEKSGDSLFSIGTSSATGKPVLQLSGLVAE